MAAAIDETIRKNELPRDVCACGLPTERRASVARQWNGVACVILAADTVVACGRRILPKAETDEEVRACLELLSGRRHQVMTAVALPRAGRQTAYTDCVDAGRVPAADARRRSTPMCVAAKASAKRAAMPSRAGPKFSYADSAVPIPMWSGLPLRETISLLRASGYPC